MRNKNQISEYHSPSLGIEEKQYKIGIRSINKKSFNLVGY